MSSEESYRAILRYLTNEREPYAPGTEGNVKRKIRKAAACYVVRGGTLYYQRRQRHRKTFAELEVVLQPERRQGLIEAAHLGPGGTHHTRHQTWHDLSKTYWWRGERRRACGLRPAHETCVRRREPRGSGAWPLRPAFGYAAAAGASRTNGRGTPKQPHFPTGRRPGRRWADPRPGWGFRGLPPGQGQPRRLGRGLPGPASSGP